MAGLEGLRGKKLHLPDPTADHGSHEEVDDSGKEGNLGKREEIFGERATLLGWQQGETGERNLCRSSQNCFHAPMVHLLF